MVAPNFPRRIRPGWALTGILVVSAFLLGLLVRGDGEVPDRTPPHDETAHRAETIWTCSMHPQIKLPKPGKCPICFMDLIPLEADEDEQELRPRSLVLSKAAAALADIQTAVVERRSISAEIRLVGKVDFDETRYRTISAWVPGRIDTLFVDFTGTGVQRGSNLVSLYSPELYAAQAELLNAVTAATELQSSDSELMRKTALATVSAARERLRLWGLTDPQIERIEHRGSPSHHLTITSPLSGIVVHKNAVEGMYVQTGTRIFTVADLSHVWVTLDAYESDLEWLREGQTIDFSVEAIPGRNFSGSIVFIDPILDERTRTVMVRLDVDNARGLLKPGMFVQAVAEAGLASHPHSAGEKGPAESPLVIPASAPLITGERAVVYVRNPDREQPTFEGREVILGPRVGHFYVVESGLSEGERVVVKGNFKIDSAMQILARPSMMNPSGEALPAGHQHTSTSRAAPTPSKEQGKSAEQQDRTSPESAIPVSFPNSSAAFLKQLDGLIGSYFHIQVALASDDDSTAARAAISFSTALDSVDMELLSGKAHLAWMADRERLESAITAFRTADDIAARREAFFPLSEAMWAALRRFEFRGSRTVRLFHCPMANQGNGADWLQAETTTANPYYGAAMLRCGSQTDSIPALVQGERGN